MTSDFNNDKKFIFLSQDNIVDYRQKQSGNFFFNGSKNENVARNPNKFPWVKEESKEEKIICDIVKKQELPIATYVSINDNENRVIQDLDPDLIIPQDKEEVS